MKLEKQLDKILEILYDKKNLIFEKVETTKIVFLGKQNYGLDWNNTEILFIMDILIKEGYVIIHKNDTSTPTYSLTSKGIRLKQNGGFVRKRRIEFLTQILIVLASIVTIIIGFTTCYDFYKKYLNPIQQVEVSADKSKQTNTKCYNYCPDSCCVKHEKSIVDSSTIRQNIKKPNIISTKK